MKVLILNSSTRVHGNTSKTLELYKKYLSNSNNTVEYIELSQHDIKICLGCRLCFDKGEQACPCHDSLLEILYKVKQNDLIIIGSPIYVEDVNGILKNWIDRMAFNCHRPIFYGKRVFIVLTSGSGASRHAVKTISRACQTWGMRVIGERRLVLGARVEQEVLEKKYDEVIRRDEESIRRKMAQENRGSFVQVLTYYIQKWFYNHREDKGSYDYMFWKEKGWLEKGSNYYSNEKVNIYKVMSSRIIGNAIIKLILK